MVNVSMACGKFWGKPNHFVLEKRSSAIFETKFFFFFFFDKWNNFILMPKQNKAIKTQERERAWFSWVLTMEPHDPTLGEQPKHD